MFRYDYNDFDWWDERSPSKKEVELKERGFDFITNFSAEKENIYRQAAEFHNLNFWIEEEAYGYQETGLPTYKGFYVDSKIGDLTSFWRTFDSLKGAA